MNDNSFCPFSGHLDFDCNQMFSQIKDYRECLECVNSFKSLLDDFLENLKNRGVL